MLISLALLRKCQLFGFRRGWDSHSGAHPVVTSIDGNKNLKKFLALRESSINKNCHWCAWRRHR